MAKVTPVNDGDKKTEYVQPATEAEAVAAETGAERFSIEESRAQAQAIVERGVSAALKKNRKQDGTRALRQYTETIDDIDFVFQYPGKAKQLALMEKLQKGNGAYKLVEMYEVYLKHVIVSPAGLSVDIFDELTEEGSDRLAEVCGEVFVGKFPKDGTV